MSERTHNHVATFLHMRSAAKEAATLRSSSLDGACTAEAANALGSILVNQMCIFRASPFAEILYLHDLWQHGNIHGACSGFGKVVPL
jgi:hypothetical protein